MDHTTLPFSFDLPNDVPFAFSLTALAEQLAPLVDQRKRRSKRYPLRAIASHPAFPSRLRTD